MEVMASMTHSTEELEMTSSTVREVMIWLSADQAKMKSMEVMEMTESTLMMVAI